MQGPVLDAKKKIEGISSQTTGLLTHHPHLFGDTYICLEKACFENISRRNLNLFMSVGTQNC